MLRQRFHIVAATLGLAVAPNAAVADEVSLRPASAWNVDWRGKSCTLARAFGTPDKSITIQFERFAPSNGFQPFVAGKGLGQVTRRSPFAIVFESNPPIDLTGLVLPGTANADNPVPILFLPTMTLMQGGNRPLDVDRNAIRVTPDMEAAVTRISLRLPGRVIHLESGSLGKAFATWRACTDELVRRWGLDPIEQAARRRPPVPLSNPGRWAIPEDYPLKALKRGQQAIINFRLSVDATGKATECEIQRAYANELFVTKTCDILMARASFEPAISAEGQPIASYFVSSVRWIIS